MNIVKSGRYSFDIHSESGTIQIFTLRPDSTRSRFLTAQEALDLLRYLQAQEALLLAHIQQDEREVSA